MIKYCNNCMNVTEYCNKYWDGPILLQYFAIILVQPLEGCDDEDELIINQLGLFKIASFKFNDITQSYYAGCLLEWASWYVLPVPCPMPQHSVPTVPSIEHAFISS